MKKKQILAILLILSIKVFSQNSKLSIETSYPILISEKGNDYDFNNYNGVIDFGIKYDLIEKEKIDFGIGFNTSFLQFKVDDGLIKFTRKHYILQPKIYGKMNLIKKLNTDLIIGIGYSIDLNSVENEKGKTYSGLNFNTGINYNITNEWFLHLQYDLIMYDKEELVYYNKNLNLIKIGVGLRI